MTKPSWQDFGTHDESAVPELWGGVVGAWAPCLGPTGLRLHDHSRRSNWGTMTNMDPPTDWVVQDGQYALDFDGANDYVAAGTSGFVNLTQVTIATWVRLTSTADEMIFNVRPTNTILNFFVFAGGVNLRGGGGALTLTVAVPAGLTNNWRHLVATINGTSASIFYEGTSIASGTVTAIGASPTGVDIAAFTDFGAGYYLAGQMSEITAWNRALTPNEIRQLYLIGRGGMYQRRRRRAIYLPQAGFQAAWALRRSQIIGGGLR
jgi:hypothetical protein